MSRKGLFITLDGIDGVGKSTQREYLATLFKNAGFEVVITREPGGTPFAEKIRELILAPSDEPVTDLTEVLLFFAARAQHLESVIVPAIERGAVVICDRFVDSTYAYQSAGGGIDKTVIDTLSRLVIGEHQPDMTFVLTMDYKTAQLRSAARGALDRMEGKPQSYYERAQGVFIQRAEANPHRYRVIDATVSIEQVQAQIFPTVMRLINNLRPRPNIV